MNITGNKKPAGRRAFRGTDLHINLTKCCDYILYPFTINGVFVITAKDCK